MKRFFAFTALFLLFFPASLSAAGADAADKAGLPSSFPTPVIAIVDVQKILEESLAAKNVQQQLEAQRSKFQAEISGEEAGLREAEQDLARLRNTVAPDIYAEKEQQLRQRFLVVERRVQNRRKALDQAFTDSMNEVKKTMLDIVEVMARERGANVVIVKQQALWSDKKMEITEEVLAQLNKILPQIQVKIAQEEKSKAKNPGQVPSLLKKQAR